MKEENLLRSAKTFGAKAGRVELSYNSNNAVAAQQDTGLSLLRYNQSCWNILFKPVDFNIYIH